MQYQVKNVTLDITRNQYADMSGECTVYIPFKHKSFITEDCSTSKNDAFTNDGYEHIFEFQEFGEVFIEGHGTSKQDI